jgi:hypothetical protein
MRDWRRTGDGGWAEEPTSAATGRRLTRARSLQIASLLVAGVVLGATVVQAIREHSFAPLLAVGWLPAVLVATLGSGRSSRRCRLRAGRSR